MAFKGLRLSEDRDFVSKNDPDAANPTVFKLRAIDLDLRTTISDAASLFEIDNKRRPDQQAKVSVNLAGQEVLAIKYGVRDIANLINPDTGKPEEIKQEAKFFAGKMRDCLPDRVIAMLPREVRMELATEIMSESTLSEPERKN